MARKTKASVATAPDTTAGAKAYALAVAHRPEIEPRIPAGTIHALGADLTTLGAPPSSPSSHAATAPPASPAAAAPTPTPSLAESLATLVNLVTAMHGAITAAKPTAALRRAYVGAGRGPVKAPKAVLAAAQKLAARAASAPSEAIGLGILPSDVAALNAAMASFTAAEALATAPRGGKAATGAPAKLKRAAAARMHEATARIAGAGALAFAQSAAIRAEFETLRAKKK